VDPIVPTILIYDRPASALEAKFSMPFCAAAAVIFGRVGIDTFSDGRLADEGVQTMMARVAMNVDQDIGRGKPALTEARVRLRLRDGRTLEKDAHGARGYPERPARQDELDAKFVACASIAIAPDRTDGLLAALSDMESWRSIGEAIDLA
jgi:2-methylcitrate dehydratase PrpD